jgi:hypothetical protein
VSAEGIPYRDPSLIAGTPFLDLDANLSPTMIAGLKISSVPSAVTVQDDLVLLDFNRPSFKAFRLIAGALWVPHLRVAAKSKTLLDNVRNGLVELACKFMPGAAQFKTGDRKLPKGESFDGQIGMVARWMWGLRSRRGQKLVNWLIEGWLEFTKSPQTSESWRPDLVLGNPFRKKSKGWYSWQALRQLVKVTVFADRTDEVPYVRAEQSISSIVREAKEIATKSKKSLKLNSKEVVSLLSKAVTANERSRGLCLFNLEKNVVTIDSRMLDLFFYKTGSRPFAVLTSEFSQASRSKSLRQDPGNNLGPAESAVTVAAAVLQSPAKSDRSRPWKSGQEVIVLGPPREWSTVTPGSPDPRFTESSTGPLRGTPRAFTLISSVERLVGKILPLTGNNVVEFTARQKKLSEEGRILEDRVRAAVEIAMATIVLPTLYRQIVPKQVFKSASLIRKWRTSGDQESLRAAAVLITESLKVLRYEGEVAVESVSNVLKAI